MIEKPSEQTKVDAMKIAKGTQKSGQTKEQTKLIAQGIEKGISEYKKQQKIKARARDKDRKKALKKSSLLQDEIISDRDDVKSSNALIPWFMLVISWIAFATYYFY